MTDDTETETDEGQRRIAAIAHIKSAAKDANVRLAIEEMDSVHGPVALLAATYLAVAREAGMPDIETIARLHWISRQTKKHDPSNRPN